MSDLVPNIFQWHGMFVCLLVLCRVCLPPAQAVRLAKLLLVAAGTASALAPVTETAVLWCLVLAAGGLPFTGREGFSFCRFPHYLSFPGSDPLCFGMGC